MREDNSASFHRQYEPMVKTHNPIILMLLEKKMDKHKALTETLKFDAQVQSSASGQKGGVVVMWKENSFKLDSISITSQGIYVIVMVLP